MSSYTSPTPSSLFDRNQGTPSSLSSYNLNAPYLAAVPLPHGVNSHVPTLHVLLSTTCTRYLKLNIAFPFHPSYCCLAPNINPSALNEPATSPPVQTLRLRISTGVNLVFDVTNPHGVLVADVFYTISKYLHQPLSRDAYGSLPPIVREATDRAYQQRILYARSHHLQGINERLSFVDCLGEQTTFYALTYAPLARDSVWDVMFV
ncbi:hypothetical protein APHAL10511_005352 [Amanita phalloides]|nr:hypothetical protein APHAL10511_005352 [Amanita phalloides]